MKDMIELGLCRLFFEAGLAVGLATMSYLRRREEDK
jgi:hypothetical protein